MTRSANNIIYITAGAAGMYCGSCMHDNTLARALTRLGVDVQLIPLYTPIRTDEEDVSLNHVFFGGINVFLEQKLPVYRHLPGFFGRLFDQPWLLRWASSRAAATSARSLGALTVSMLKGAQGYQKNEVQKLCSWLSSSARPQLICFSNMLITGCIPEIKRALDVPVVVTLQGDDIFLDQLEEPFRTEALAEIRRLVDHVDGFLVHSDFYAERMHRYLGIPREKFYRVPLGIDVDGFALEVAERDGPPTIGYLARLAPEKGLHVLVDAFLELHKQNAACDARLHLAGWLGPQNRSYAESQFEKLRAAGLQDAWHYAGSVDRAGKIEFLRGLDVLSVPTTYQEPKGLFVLESLAAGVPVVQPSHGAFPELIETLGGGLLVPPNQPQELGAKLAELLQDRQSCKGLGEQGRRRVLERFHAEAMARATLETFSRFL